MLRAVVIFAIFAVSGTASLSDVRPETDTLLKTMRFPDLIAIMREEGIEYGAALEDELFPGRGGSAWAAVVEKTYGPERMYDVFATRFDKELSGEVVEPIIEFFDSERGQRITEFEISARRALLDDGIEEAAVEAYQRMRASGEPRVDLVGAFIDTNDLIEQNVMGALNSNFAFYTGLIDGNAFPQPLSEDQVLADVWSQEPEIRSETTDWVFSYLLMAYQPLSDADLEVYIAMSETDGGRALNRALFAAFDELFVEISRELGFAAARFLSGQDI